MINIPIFHLGFFRRRSNIAAHVFSLFLLMLALASCAPADQDHGLSQADIALNNKGVALMGRFDYKAASEVFSELTTRNPHSHQVRVNYAIGLKNRQWEGDGELALEQLSLVLLENPKNAAANYVSGVLELYHGRVEQASQFLATALELDPNDAYAHYYLGQSQLRSGEPEAALASYQKAIALDPYLRSAYYSAALVLRRLGNNEEATEQLSLFKRFENNPSARLAEFKYTRMGPKASAAVIGGANIEHAVSIPAGELFGAKKVIAKINNTSFIDTSVTTADIKGSGTQDLYLSSGSEQGSLLLMDKTATSPSLSLDPASPLSGLKNVNATAWGDINNDGLVDAYLCRNGDNHLWIQHAEGQWSRVIEGLDAEVNHCVDAAMLDADHDGDLDIVVINRGASDNLLNNNRDGSFTSIASKIHSETKPQGSEKFIASDLDADNDVDLIFIGETGSHKVLVNDRQWNYTPDTAFADFEGADIAAVTAVDLNSDAQTELLTLNSKGEISLWQRALDGHWSAVFLYKSELTTNNQSQLFALDLSGDGSKELVLGSAHGFEVLALRVETNIETFSVNVSATKLMQEHYKGSMVAPVIRSNQGYSLIALIESDDGAALVEWPPGAGRSDFLTVSFTGKHDSAETMRSNSSGIGTRVNARIGANWHSVDTFKNTSASGYSLQPVAIGLGGAAKADFLAVNWSDGVYQTELDVAAGSKLTIAEEQRQLGSCPVLFAWNGEKFEFVTDILGVAAQGFWVGPGSTMPPRPWEYVGFEPGKVVSREGRLQFKLAEPMEESSYIDSLALEVIDLPSEWNMVVDERMGTAAPIVTGEPLFYRTLIKPKRAHNALQQDVLSEVSAKDSISMPPGEIDRRYIGLLKDDQSLTLEFDQPINAASLKNKLPVLMAYGWVELPYSQTHFAAWQAGREFKAVSLEARDQENNWKMIYKDFGIPAGMPRETVLPLAGLPEDTSAIRLSWNRELYWDRIQIVYAEPAPVETRRQSILPTIANVNNSGFSKRLTHAQRRPEYDYQQRRPFGDVRYPTGFYTNIGEMTELVNDHDNALAIIGPGEEVHVEFAEPAEPELGMRRWYILETRGWAKDKDMYTQTGATVEPLPQAPLAVAEAQREQLHQKYNTRFLSGR